MACFPCYTTVRRAPTGLGVTTDGPTSASYPTTGRTPGLEPGAPASEAKEHSRSTTAVRVRATVRPPRWGLAGSSALSLIRISFIYYR